MGRSVRQSSTTTSLRYYAPGADHQELVLEAIEIWSYDPEYLYSPADALRLQKEMGRVREDSSQHMERVLKAFLYETESASPGPGPFYRGQNGALQIPEGVASWSRSPEAAFLFAALHPSASGPDGSRSVPSLEQILEEGLELKEGERLEITVFVAEGASSGVDINNHSQDLFIRSLLDKLEAGRALDVRTSRNEKLTDIRFDAKKLKRVVYLAAIKRVGRGRVLRALGIGQLSEEKIIRFVSGQSLAQMNAFLSRLGEESVSRIWQKRISEIRSLIQEADFVVPLSQYPVESEVVLSSAGIEGLRRVNVCLAASAEELSSLTEERAEKLFREAIRERVP